MVSPLSLIPFLERKKKVKKENPCIKGELGIMVDASIGWVQNMPLIQILI